MAGPAQPKIYHICHVDRLPSIIASAGLLSDPVPSVEEVVARTYAWNARKKQVTPRQIGIAVDVLASKDWIKPIALSA